MLEILWLGWLSAIILSFATGPLGSFIIWNRLSYFGDTLSHSSLLGLAFATLFNIDPFYTVIIVALLLSSILLTLEHLKLSIDTLLNIISQSFLSLGLIIMHVISHNDINLIPYLFGNLLSITKYELYYIILFVSIIVIILCVKWKELLSTTINIELAEIDGINTKKIRIILIFMIAMTIGFTMKFVGSLIINALLIIPAATARQFSKSPEQMVILSIIISIFSITGGFVISSYYDIPSCPAIIFCTSIFFLFSIFQKIKF